MTFQHMVTYQGIKSHKACPICEENTLLNNWDVEKRQYIFGIGGLLEVVILTEDWKAFNGYQETGSPPTPLTDVEDYEKINNINHTFGQSKKKSFVTNIWKKN